MTNVEEVSIYNTNLNNPDTDGDGLVDGEEVVIYYTNPLVSDIMVDIDGDGQSELVTGKRFRAHCGNDVGSGDDVGIYYFKWNGESFSKQIIDYGPPGMGKGCGIFFPIADINGNSRLDIVAPGKDGLYFFENLGN